MAEFPRYLSPSQISSLTTCGEQFRLTRKVRVQERPQWAGIGGSAVHRMTEDIDRAALGTEPFVAEWDTYWTEAFDAAKERSPEWDPEDYYTGGRASKEWPDKEGPEWWAVNGPKFVRSWSRWLEHSGLEVWEYPDENGELQPAIELEVYAEKGDLIVRSIIDRVLHDPLTGHLYIVDIKTGSMTAAWPQQMALNNLGFKTSLASPHEHGAAFAGFWKARGGGVLNWFDLSVYTDEWLWRQVGMAKAIRDQELFIAQPTNLCNSACGVRRYCAAVGGDLAFLPNVQP